MTTRDLGHDLGPDRGPHRGPGLALGHAVASNGASIGDGERPEELASLFDHSPARVLQTSAAAGTGFVLGLLGLLAAPFALTLALSLGLATVALVSSVVGMARASRPTRTGGLLASVGLVLSLVTLALVGLRYLGVDTTFGDALAPSLREWLAALDDLVPAP